MLINRIWSYLAMLPSASRLGCSALVTVGFLLRNERADCGSGQTASFSFGPAASRPLEHLRARYDRLLLRSTTGGEGKSSTRGLCHLWPPITVVFCFLPRLRPIGVHLKRHGYPRFTHEMQRWASLAVIVEPCRETAPYTHVSCVRSRARIIAVVCHSTGQIAC